MNLFYIENTYNGTNTVTLTSTQSGTPSSSSHASSVEYSKDGSSWSSFTLTAGGTNTVSLNSGEKVYFRNNSGKWNYYDSISFYTTFTADHSHIVGGDVRSLLNYNNDNITLPDYGCFFRLFYGNTNLTDASALSLPSTTLKTDCYHAMFRGCTALTTPPELNRGINLAPQCYEQMFYGCTHLTTAPVLRATTLAFSCYGFMFTNCTALTTAPVLPATTLADSCYTSMFKGCTHLTSAPSLPATILKDYCYKEMFSGCTLLNEVTVYANDISASNCLYEWLNNVAATGTFHNEGDATYPTGASGIPSGWTEVGPDYFYIQNLSVNSRDVYVSPTISDLENPVCATSVRYKVEGGSSWTNHEFIQWVEDDPEMGDGHYEIVELTVTVPAGGKVYFRGIDGVWSNYVEYIDPETGDPAGESLDYIVFGGEDNSGDEYAVGGDIMTLIDWTGQPSIGDHSFYRLFTGFTKLTDASDLSLPNTVANHCYNNMFAYCYSLTSAPSLPATTLAEECYGNMFYNCTSLTSAPALPATTLADVCYSYMFSGCTALTSAPSLPATTLPQNCYEGMFYGCTSLTTAPSLPATTLPQNCYEGMFYGCTALTSAPSLPATTLADSCYSGMFASCTSLTTAPSLPATTLVFQCYKEMFMGCTSLNEVTVYADDNSAGFCTLNWLYDVANSGTFYNMGSATYPTNSGDGIPTGWTEVGPTPSTYTITATAGQNGSISPSGAVSVNVGASQTFTVTPDAGYIVDTLTVDGSTATLTNDTYTFSNVQADHTISVTFKLPDLTDYFYIENTYSGSNTVTLTTSQSGSPTAGTYATSVQYSKDKNSWTTLTLTAGGTNTITLNQGEKVYFRNDSGKWNYYLTSSNYFETKITANQAHTVGGNINTLLDYTDLNNVSLSTGCFNDLFYHDSSMTSASSLSLPTTTLAQNCYKQMFLGCSNLTATPVLPATTLADSCYSNMFNGCTHLTTSPVLSATTLTQSCYVAMFRNCTSLTTAPSLPATTLARNCYYQMFNGCSSLNEVTTYADDISASDCITNWLQNVAATGTFYNNGTATYTVDSPSGIPSGWTEVKPIDYFYIENTYNGQNTVTLTTVGSSASQASSVEYSKDRNSWTTLTLTAGGANTITLETGEKVYFRNDSGKWNSGTNNYTTFNANQSHIVGGNVNTLLDYTNLNNITLTNYCFHRLFRSDSNLTSASNLSLPATTLASYCYKNMFSVCTSLTTVPTLPATTLAERCYSQMFSGCTALTTAPSLPATTLAYAYDCYNAMFYGCTALTTAPSLPATTLENDCYKEMFYGCTALTTAPSLPATTLVIECYRGMFYGCTSLNSVTTYANIISATFCLRDWLYNVAATGTFYNNGSATYTLNSASGIPTGWTEVRSSYTITATAGSNGSISPSGSVSVNTGADQTFTFIPDTGYEVDTVTVDGSTVTPTNNTYTFTNVQADHTISVTFKLRTFTINTISEAHVIVNPSGIVSVNYGADQTFTFSPEIGYELDKLYIDGIETSYTGSSYTFTNIQSDHTLEITSKLMIFTLTASAGQNGSISPSGSTIVNYGASQTYTITPDTGYEIDTLTVDGSTVTPTGNTYTFTNVTADHTISVTFELAPVYHTIVATAHENANISPSGSVSVLEGDDQSFSVYPDAGYEISDIEVDGSSVGSVSSYTFRDVQANHTIDAYAIPIPPTEYQIMAFGYDHANINPSGTITVIEGNDQTFTMTADTGYQISDVLVDGVSVGAVSSYTFRDVQADHEITVYGEPIPVPTYNCSVTVATTGGSVMPLSATVDEGQDITFTVTTEAGYAIDNLIDNGTDVTSRMVGNTYTISDVSADHTLSISFVRVVIQYTIVSTAGEGGSISPLGRTYVDEGSSQTYTITPDEGNVIDRLIVDGHEVTPAATYIFENVVSNHTIEATFKETPPPPPPVPDYGLDLSEMIDTDYVVQYRTK